MIVRLGLVGRNRTFGNPSLAIDISNAVRLGRVTLRAIRRGLKVGLAVSRDIISPIDRSILAAVTGAIALDRVLDLLHVADALGAVGVNAVAEDRRNGNRREDRDNGHDDHQLDKGEALDFLCIHVFVFPFLFCKTITDSARVYTQHFAVDVSIVPISFFSRNCFCGFGGKVSGHSISLFAPVTTAI